MPKNVEKVECISCGICCGHQRDYPFGGCSYSKEEPIPTGVKVIQEGDNYRIPVDNNDVCIYVEVLDNGFTKCKIHDKKPLMCKYYYCLLEQKITSLKRIIEYLEKKCENRHSLIHLVNSLKVR